jgi:SAM-dependent methyltransferase
MSIYIHTEDIHNLEGPREVVPLLFEMLHPASVLDVGCGIGTWLKAFEEIGVSEYVGLDGNHVDKRLLKIPEDKFVTQDFLTSWQLDRRFDLVLSLEVAEHLPQSASDLFVQMLVNHGDQIIFSAAVPGQGGQNHLNEQWLSYWQEKFEAHGYYFHDTIRPLIWNNEKIQWWYRQNMFLISKKTSSKQILNAIHPDLFSERTKMVEDLYSGRAGVQISISILVKSLRNWISKL